MTTYWMIQVDEGTVEEISQDFVHRGNRAQHRLPANRMTMEPLAGDPVVLWRKGSGVKAGAVALGFIAEVVEAFHARNYRETRQEKDTLRRSVNMVVTHLFTEDPVLRVELKEDPRFADFTMFKRGGAQVANPWELEKEQFEAITERMPDATQPGFPFVKYKINVEGLFEADGTLAALEQFKTMVRERDYERMGMEIRSADTPADAEADSILEPQTRPDSLIARLVMWDTEVLALSPTHAFLNAVRKMKKAGDSLTERDLRVIEFEQYEPESTGV
ncbi:hypothetical protein ACIPVK_19170 [Paeniglutamicibacter sp. MACA_103]|uniref:hypothetical protein n=1 Tax=Paeniglutamicibacter sp. MACA_103 TaxID=3377337 RepID=UPI00389449F6